MGEVRQPTYSVTDPITGTTITKTSRVWWIRYYRDGRRYEESAKTTKKGVAESLLKSREGKIADGVPVSAAIGRVTFDQAAADVVTDYQVNAKRSLAHVKRRIEKHLEPYFGGRRLASITTDVIRAFVADRQTAGASNAEINRELAIVKRAYNLALQAGKILHKPHVPMLREANVRTGFLEAAAFDAIRAALPAPYRGPVTLAYLTGWRCASEVLPLEWSHVDRTRQTIRLDPGTTKNAEGRTLPYGDLPAIVTVISEAWTGHEALKAAGTLCPFVFHRDGARLRAFHGIWRRACEAAGYPGTLLHDCRRTAVRNLVRAGVPEKTAMGITGHKTRSVFDRYDIVTETDLRQALGKLAAPAVAGKEKGKTGQAGQVRRFRKRR